MKGRSKKFEYILSDGAQKIMDIEGDEFSECDYGLAVDNSNGTIELSQQINTLAQAALQNQKLDFSTIMKLYSSGSTSEKVRLVEASEKRLQEQMEQQQQQQLQAQQQAAQQQLEQKQAELDIKEQQNIRDNETKIIIAQIGAEGQQAPIDTSGQIDQKHREKLSEQVREFNAKLKLENDKLELSKKKFQHDITSSKK